MNTRTLSLRDLPIADTNPTPPDLGSLAVENCSSICQLRGKCLEISGSLGTPYSGQCRLTWPILRVMVSLRSAHSPGVHFPQGKFTIVTGASAKFGRPPNPPRPNPLTTWD